MAIKQVAGSIYSADNFAPVDDAVASTFDPAAAMPGALAPFVPDSDGILPANLGQVWVSDLNTGAVETVSVTPEEPSSSAMPGIIAPAQPSETPPLEDLVQATMSETGFFVMAGEGMTLADPSSPTMAPPSVAFASEPSPVTITANSNPGPVGSQGSLLLVAGLAHTTGPTLGASKTSDDTIAGRAIDTAAITALTASLDGGAAVSELGAIGAGGGFTLTPAMLATLAGGTLADGTHTVVINATDAIGNTTAAGVTFTLDSVAPTLNAGLTTVTGTTTLAQTIGATKDPTVAGSGHDSAGIISLYGTLDGVASYANLTGAIGGNGAFTITPAVLASLAGGTLPDGKHALVLQTTDTAGNVATQTVNFTLETQLGVPTLALAASDQTANATTTGGSAITLLGTTTPGAIATLTNTGAIATAGATGLFQFTNVPVAPGGSSISVQVTDLAGNSNNGSLDVAHLASGGTDPVLEWDAATRHAITVDASPPTVASRALAIESLSVYNAVSAINGTPGFLSSLTAPAGADARAATIAAANKALDSLYPAQAAGFDAQAAADLAAIPNSLAKTEGIAVGQQAAAAMLALRANDGTADNGITDLGSSTPGQWQMTAPAFMPALQPQWATATPFALQSPSQFLPTPPPDITTQAYADAVNQTFLLGDLNSATRTAAETQKALFFNDQTGTDTPAGQWNQIAAGVSQANGLGLSQNALLFAELNVAEADAAIAAWNGKFTYNAWRPITLFDNSAAAGNPAIDGDPNWRPLIVTPPFPEYPEGHGTFSGAAATVLANFFGDNTSFSATSQSTPGVTLNYTSFSSAASDAAMSRVWGGIHFTFSADAALTLGGEIGQWTLGAFNSGADTTPPKVTLNNPGGDVTNRDPTVTGTVSSSFGVTALNALLQNGQTENVPVNPDGSFSFTVPVALDGAADGAHNVTFVAIDPAGNRSPAVTYAFSLVTHAPVITLAADSVKNGATIGAGAMLDGTIGLESGDSLTSLRYAFDGGASTSIVTDPQTGAFDETLDVSALAAGPHQLTLTALDAAGNSTTQYMTVTYKLPPLLLTSITPVVGASNVGVTFRPSIEFSRAVDPATLTSSDFYATDSAGTVLPATIVPFADGTGAWLLPTGQFPGSSAITLVVKGGGIKAAADGVLLDAADIGQPGSSITETYSTVSTAPVFGTTISGLIVDPGPDGTPLTPDDVKSSVGNSSVFATDTWKLPIAGAKVYILGDEQDAVFSGADGSFNLASAPVGDVKVVVDGRTATNAPSGYFFPEMVLDITVKAGVNNLIPGAMGSPQQQAGMAGDPAVYLPRVASSSLTTLSTTTQTTVTAPAESNLGSGAFTLTQQQLANLSLTVQANSIVDANGNPVGNAQVGIAPVPASIVQDMLPPGLMQHSFDITIQAPGGSVFTTPAQLTMPNVFGLAPGEKTYILSFDHTTGRLVIDGTATASADGQTVTTDPSAGVMAPGWHGMTPPGTDGKGKVGDECPSTLGGAYGQFITSQGQANKTALSIVTNADLVVNTTSNVWSMGSGVVGAAGSDLGHLGHFGNGLSAGADAYSLINNVGTNAADVYKHPTDPWAWGQLALQFIHDGANLALDAGGYIPGPAGRIASGARAATAGIDMYYDFHPPGGGAPPASAPALQTQVKNATNSNAWSSLFEGFAQAGGAQGVEVAAAASTMAMGLGHPADPAVFDAVVARVQAEADYQLPFWLRIQTDLTALTVFDAFDFTKPDLGVTPGQLAALLPQLPALQADMVDYANAVAALANHETLPQLAKDLVDGAAEALAMDNEAFFMLIERPAPIAYAAASVASHSAPALGNEPQPVTVGASGLGAQVQANASQTVSAPASDPGNLTVANQRGTTTMYVALKSAADGSVQRQSFNAGQGYDFFMAPNTYYQVTIFDPSTNSIGQGFFQSGSSGQDTTIPLVGLVVDPDAPGINGLTPTESYVIGVNSTIKSNLVPGVTDLAALQQGLYNGSVLPGTTGLVASLPLLGSAQSIVLAGSSSTGQSTYAYVATGGYGLAIVDVSNPFTPIALGQIALGGNATGVAINSALNIAVVATGAGGLKFVDVSNPNLPTVVRSSLVGATNVQVIGGIAYVDSGTSIDSFDIATGTLLQTLNLGGSIVTGLASAGTTLYTMDAGRALRVIDTSGGAMAVQGSVGLPAGGLGLFAGNGVIYVAAANGDSTGGYLTVDVSNPGAPVLIEGVDNPGMAGAAIALNGSGAGITVQAIQEPPPNPGVHNVADLINTSDPTKTGLLQTRFELPSKPQGVTIGAGIGFIADGPSGLQVLNYLAPDLNGVAPTLTVTAAPVDVDPNTAGTQVYEGVPVSLSVTVTDDVQVRNVELLVNGSVAANVLSFRFALTGAMPTIANLGTNAVTLQVEAIDTGGNTTFSAPINVQLVADTRPLRLLSQSVSEGAVLSQYDHTISLTFSKPLDPATVTTADFRIVDQNGSAVTPDSLVLTANNQVVQLNYTSLAIGPYHLIVDAPLVADLNGVKLGTATLTTDFAVQAFSSIFTNTAGGSWNTASNWNTNAVPGAADAVYVGNAIGAAVSYDGGSASVAKLTASGGGLFQVTGGGLTVTDLLQVNEPLVIGGGGFAAPGVVTIGAQGGIFVNNRSTSLDNVSVSAGGQIQVSNNNFLYLDGTLANQGLIMLNGVTGYDTRLVIPGTVAVSGGGQILLSNSPSNRITSNGSAATLTNAGNTISGGGTIGDGNLTLINLAGGTINASAPNAGLVIQGGQPVTNAGLMESTSAASLLIRSATVTNTGTIAAPVAGSVVNLQSSSITGGTLMTANGGVIQEIDRGSVLADVTIAQDSNLGVTNNNFLYLQGTVTNLGSMYLAGASGYDTRFVATGATTLTGGGQVQFSDTSSNYVTSNGTSASLINLNNTISGGGRIGDQSDALLSMVNATKGVINASAGSALTIALGGATLTNTGTIESTSTVAGNGGLVLYASTIDNTGSNNAGIILSNGANSHVNLQSATVLGGTLVTASGGAIVDVDRGTTLDNVTLSPGSNLAVVNQAFLYLANTFTNHGIVSVNGSQGYDTRIMASGGVTLTGTGVVHFSDTSSTLLDGNKDAVLTNVDNTIEGSGYIGDGNLTFINAAAGTVDATGTNAQLVLTGGNKITNAGLIEDTGPAGLRIRSTTVDNSGIIQAMLPGSHVDLESATINGGVLATANGGVIYATDRGSVLNNVALSVASASTLVITNNHVLSLIGTLTNHGSIVLVGNDGYDTRLGAIGGVTLTGGGQIQLSDTGSNFLMSNGAAASFINQDNTISGGGRIGDQGDALLTMTNQTKGLINASAGNALRIALGGGTLSNTGTIESTSTIAGNGGLVLYASVIDNTGSNNAGVILSSGTNSHVNLQSATVLGGTLVTADGGTIYEVDRGGTLDNATLATASNIVVISDQWLYLQDTFTNHGTVTLAGNQGYTTRLVSNGGVTLTGSGVIQLSDVTSNYVHGAAGAALTNVNNTIQGSGVIGDGNLTVTNAAAGTINATGTSRQLVLAGAIPFANAGVIEDSGPAGLTISSTTVNNSGTIQAMLAGSHVDLQSATINGGVLAMANGGAFYAVDRGSVLNNVAISIASAGALVVINNEFLTFSGTVTNHGTVSLAGNNGYDTRLIADGIVTLNGGGVVQMSDANSNRLFGNAGAVLANVDNVITGSGTIGDGALSLTNAAAGTINASGGGQRLKMTGSIAFNNAGLIESTGQAGLWLYGTSVTNSGTIAAPVAGSHVDLESAAINGGLLTSANGGFFQAVDRGSVLNGLTVGAGAAVNVVNNQFMYLQGTIVNQGTVSLNGSNGYDTRLISDGTVSLTGGGVVSLSDASSNRIFGNPGATLTNVDNLIQGSGTIGDSILTFTNAAAGTINASGSGQRLELTGSIPLTNAGLIETTGPAGLWFYAVTVNNTGAIEAMQAGSHVDLQSAAINGGLLASANGGFFHAVDRGSVLNGVTLGAGTQFGVDNNQFLTLQGAMKNQGTISINGFSGYDTGLIVVSGVTLSGGGVIQLPDNHATRISSSATNTAITILDNTIAGAGTFGDGNMTVSIGAAGIINATGGNGLSLGTGANTVSNAGVLEASGPGGLNVSGGGGVANSGTVWSNGAGLYVAGAVTGTGAGRISGGATLEFGSSVASGQTISFDAGATGTLRLDASQAFAGTVSGLATDASNALDLSDIGFIGGTTKATFVGDTNGGTLTVTDNTHVANIGLLGNYAGRSFVVTSDGHNGTKVTDPDAAADAAMGSANPEPAAILAMFLGAQSTIGTADLLPVCPWAGVAGDYASHGAAVAGTPDWLPSDLVLGSPVKTGWLTT